MIENEMIVKHLKQVVVLFSGDSGDGMQLAGGMFSNVCAVLGNDICTFPDYPAEIRAPQGSLGGVSGFRVHVGANKVFTPGDKCDVLVAMNPAALKSQIGYLTPKSIIIVDTDTFNEYELQKALFKTDDPFTELHLNEKVIGAPITSMCKESLKDSGMDNKSIVRCKNMMALGLVCWLFNRPIDYVEKELRAKFAKKLAIAEANIKVLNDGFNYGHNVHASVPVTYTIDTESREKGFYMDVNGNKATAYGLIAAAEKAGLELYLGSYPITPATDILHELAKHKSLGVKTVQCEDEMAGCSSAIGAAYAGDLAVTTTSGPGVCLKSEALNLAVMAELPLLLIDVQRGGPSTGLPTKSEQTDLLQVLYGRNGDSPLPVVAASSPTDCFDTVYQACKVAVEHITPVVFLSDAFIANGSAAWKLPNLNDYPAIHPHYVKPEQKNTWTPYMRDPETLARYWAIPGMEGYEHVIGGLEKRSESGVICYDSDNHEKMVKYRQEKVDRIANVIPNLKVMGDKDADLLVVGWGGTYGYLYLAVAQLRACGKKVAFVHFHWISPLPKNTENVLKHYKKIIVAEQNSGQLAGYLRMKIEGLPSIRQYNRIGGFQVQSLVDFFINVFDEK
jgi:2-oxoglutarate/2-oxoacid ferredoxin oxidoreductase subunit alpha